MKLKIFNYVLIGFRNLDGKLVIHLLKHRRFPDMPEIIVNFTK
jgi:hypothetical protein